MALYLRHLKEVWGDPISQNKIDCDLPIGKVSTDTRTLKAGSFFVPLVGDNFDGHEFLHEAVKLDVQAAIVSKHNKFPIPKDLIYWLVDDTLEAYQKIALLHRRDLGIPVIAVTGSVGKTTTRQLISSSLSGIGAITSTLSNNNNDVGVPQTILSANSNDKAIVVEMAMRGLGEITRLSRCSEPNIVVITNIGTSHVGLLGSRANIAKAKCEVTSYLHPDGLVVIPAGDPLLETELSKVWNGRVVRVSLSHDKNKALLSSSKELVGNFISDTQSLELEGDIFHLPLHGRHNALNFLLALGVSREFSIPKNKLKRLKIVQTPGRNSILSLDKITILDETYNASPESVYAALNLLVNKPGRHFAVLGEMRELGEFSIDLHRQVVERVIELSLDGLVIVAEGRVAESINDVAANLITRCAVVSSAEEALTPLKSWLRCGDVVLLKASRAIELERLIPLLAHLNL